MLLYLAYMKKRGGRETMYRYMWCMRGGNKQGDVTIWLYLIALYPNYGRHIHIMINYISTCLLNFSEGIQWCQNWIHLLPHHGFTTEGSFILAGNIIQKNSLDQKGIVIRNSERWMIQRLLLL